MSTANNQSRTMPQSQSQSQSNRHHPYATSSGASSSRQQPGGPSTTRKWATRSPERGPAPPSPPRSRRDQSESPPAGLGAAFGGRDGGKWWDEELPPPPASLNSILDSFRRSGEGDRDLLLAILGAKKAEEERLTSLIQTRLTILQARLSVHAAATSTSLPSPTSEPMYSPRSSTLLPPVSTSTYPVERTPSLTSRASASSSAGPVSPAEAPLHSHQQLYASYETRDTKPTAESYHLPPPSNLWRKVDPAQSLPPIRVHGGEYAKSNGRASPVSPRSDHNGLEMLLDAGRRVDSRIE